MKRIVSREAPKTTRNVTIGEQRDISVGGASVGGLETSFANRSGVTQGHTQQGTIVSIIGAKAEDAANVGWFQLRARRTGSGTDCSDQSEWCWAFNVSATQQISAATLRKFLIYSTEFTGEGYCLEDRGPNGFTLSPLIGYRIDMLFAKPRQRNPDGSVAHCAGYRVRDTTGKIIGLYDSLGFPQSGDLGGRLIRFWEPHMSDPFRPHSRVMAAGLSIDVVHAANLAVRSFMQNCGTPGGIVTVADDSFTEESIQDLDNRLNSKLTDPTRKGRYLVVGTDLDVQPVADSAPSKGWADLSKWARDDIRAIWGIPETRLAQGGNKTYENADVENKQWYRGPVFGALTNIANSINLVSRAQGIEHYFDMASIPELTVDDGSLLRATTLFGDRIIVLNEARAMVGLPPVPGGDAFSQDPAPTPPTPPANSDIPAGRDAAPFVRAAEPHPLATKLDRLNADHIDAFGAFAQQYHVRVYKRVAGAIKRMAARDATDTMPPIQLGDVFSSAQWDTELHADVTTHLRTTALATAALIAAHSRKPALSAVGGDKAVTDRTRLLIAGTGAVAGWNAGIARDLGRAFDPAGQQLTLGEALAGAAAVLGVEVDAEYDPEDGQDVGGRAGVLSSRGVVGLVAAVAMLSYQSQGVQGLMWQTMGDDRVRPTHEEADGQIVGPGEPFQVGDASLMGPGDPDGPPEEVENCRCVIVPADVKS